MRILSLSSLRRFIALSSIVACAVLVAPGGAGAATVVNGDLEAGNLSGWQTSNTVPSAWLAYSGTLLQFSSPEAPALPVPPPPQGNFAAVTLQEEASRQILYQDVTLEPYYTHQLSLTAFYVAYGPISAPNTLELKEPVPEGEFEPNEQYRIDVMRQGAPVDSVNPSDILATVFATKTGDPESMAPTQFTADLTPFAGQTVRLRMAVAVNVDELNAGVDAVTIASVPPSNSVRLGKPKLGRNGMAKLPVTVPGPGVLTLIGKGVVKQKKTPTAASTVKLLVKSKGKKSKALDEIGKVKVKVKVTFTPTGGTANTTSKKLVLKKRLP